MAATLEAANVKRATTMSNDTKQYVDAHALLLQQWVNPELKKVLGSKPTAEQLAAAVLLGNRPGKQTLALAMAMRPEGATGAQIQVACGAPQNNKRADMIKAAFVKRIMTAPNALGHEVYKVELTPKGRQICERNAARQAALDAAGEADPVKPAKVTTAKAVPAKVPAKVKGASKAKKATSVAVVETPTSEPATATEQASIAVPAEPDIQAQLLEATAARGDSVISPAE